MGIKDREIRKLASIERKKVERLDFGRNRSILSFPFFYFISRELFKLD